jgi:hypothetical protein
MKRLSEIDLCDLTRYRPGNGLEMTVVISSIKLS